MTDLNNKTEIKKIKKLKKLILKNINNYYINNNEVHIADYYLLTLNDINKFNIYFNLNNNKILIYKRWTGECWGEINYNNYIKLINKKYSY